MAVEGRLVAPDGFEGLIGLNATNGQKRWSVPAAIARGATPALWRHGGKAYLLCPFGRQGKITLVDLAHSWGGVRIAMYALEPGGVFKRLGEINLEKDLKVQVVTDYEVANEMACWKGRFFAKTREGLACIDIRKAHP